MGTAFLDEGVDPLSIGMHYLADHQYQSCWNGECTGLYTAIFWGKEGFFFSFLVLSERNVCWPEKTGKRCVLCSLQRGLWHCLELSNWSVDGIYCCEWCALFPPQCAQQEGSTSAHGFRPWTASLAGLWRLSFIITVSDCKRQPSAPDKTMGELGMVEKQLAGLAGFFK